MAENSKIEWCDHTVNLWWGCAKVHTGCKNCYAEYLSDTRYKNELWGEGSERRLVKSAWRDLDRYQRDASSKGVFYKVFVGSMMDIFEEPKKLEKNDMVAFGYTDYLRIRLFEKIENGRFPNLIFLFLTKRPKNIAMYLPNSWWADCPGNVWFGTSISDYKTYLLAEELVKNTPVKSKRFLSIEPQVGFVNLGGYLYQGKFDWIIQGGESGKNKRPFYLSWAYYTKQQCKDAGVPYFFKQIDKVQEIPGDLQVREFPEFG